MFEQGQIVFLKDVYMQNTKRRRPHIVLFSRDTVEGSEVCTCPLTVTLDPYNKNGQNYYLIPEIIHGKNRLTLAKISEANFYSSSITTKNNFFTKVSESTMSRMMEKLYSTDFLNNHNIETLEEIKEYILYLRLFKELETQKEKQEKNYAKRLAKQEAKKFKYFI